MQTTTGMSSKKNWKPSNKPRSLTRSEILVYLAQWKAAEERDYPEKPIPVSQPRRRNSSGYKWRGVELTRAQLICLLIFSQGMNVQETAQLLGKSTYVIGTRATTLFYVLRFTDRKDMMVTVKTVNFAKHFPPALIDSLFDEMERKKFQK